MKSAIEKKPRWCLRTSFDVPTMPMSGFSNGEMQCGRKFAGQYTESSQSTVKGVDTCEIKLAVSFRNRESANMDMGHRC